MMSRPFGVPGFDESASAEREAISAVCVSDFEDGPGDRFGFGNEQFRTAAGRFRDREQCDRTILDGHLDGEAAAHFAVINAERSDFSFTFGNGQVTGSIVSPENDIVAE